ncbi:MAG: PBP1A family penicillin-binding protein [bacterium]|nr:PBP1A family penicillin-binding protein [bacterium]
MVKNKFNSFRKSKKTKNAFNTTVFIIGILVFMAVFAAVGFAATMYFNLQKEIPSMTDMFVYSAPSATLIYDDNNRKVTELYLEKRMPIRLKELPQYAIDAVIALEDQQFYSHWGINVVRFLGALTKTVFTMKKGAGASTITQQLARNMFLTMEKTWTRKIKEALITINLERNFSKDEILEMYFNQINYSSGAYGIEAASNMYFNKSARELTLAEAAMLAGIPQIPEKFNLFRHYDNAKKRQRICLYSMLKEGYISKEEYDDAIDDSVVVTKGEKDSGYGRYFIEEVRKDVISRFGMNTLYKGGLKIYTTMNSDMQMEAEKVIEKKMLYFEKMYRFKYTKEKYEQEMAKDTLSEAVPQYLQASMVIIENETGEVKAIVGGRDFEHSEYNRALQSKRQPGSIFKIFLFSAAVENGMNPGDIIMDTPVVLDDGSDTPYKPRNFDGDFLGPIPLRKALALSRNVTAIRLIKSIGPGTVVKHAKKLGVGSQLTPVLSLALGSNDVTLFEMVRAFSVFPNKGVLKETSTIRYIEDAQGNVIYKNENLENRVMNDDDAYIVTNMLESVVKEGTAAGLKYYKFNVHIGGKTGTTDDYSNTWFVGFTKEYTAGVWVGFDRLRTIADKATGAVLALPIWAETMKPFVNSADSLPFEQTDSIIHVTVCRESGQIATKYCKFIRDEIYKKNREPKISCEKHIRGYSNNQDFDFSKQDILKDDDL